MALDKGITRMISVLDKEKKSIDGNIGMWKKTLDNNVSAGERIQKTEIYAFIGNVKVIALDLKNNEKFDLNI